MPNRFEDEFPPAAQCYRLPPSWPADVERYIERAHQLRAEAMQRAVRRLGAAVARAVRAAARAAPAPGSRRVG